MFNVLPITILYVYLQKLNKVGISIHSKLLHHYDYLYIYILMVYCF
jgi:hypothetical protein